MAPTTAKERKEIGIKKKRLMYLDEDGVVRTLSPQKATDTDSLAAKRRRKVIIHDNDTNHKMNQSSHDDSNRVSSAPPLVQIPAITETHDNADADFTKTFSIGNLIVIDTHKYQEKVKMLGLGGSCNAMKEYSIRSAVLAHCMQREFDNLEAKKDAQIKQIAELENRLFESEKKTSMKNEEITILKKKMEEFSLEKSEWMKREEELMEENWKITLKLQMLENTHKVTADKVKDEIEELKAGFDKAVKHVLASLPT